MADVLEPDAYADELVRRFEEFTQWAIVHWPQKNYPLMSSDFAASRREISGIVGRKLHEGESMTPPTAAQEDPPYLDVSPTPWP